LEPLKFRPDLVVQVPVAARALISGTRRYTDIEGGAPQQPEKSWGLEVLA